MTVQVGDKVKVTGSTTSSVVVSTKYIGKVGTVTKVSTGSQVLNHDHNTNPNLAESGRKVGVLIGVVFEHIEGEPWVGIKDVEVVSE